MTDINWTRAQIAAESTVKDAKPDTAQLALFVLAERALTESAKWPSFMAPDGSRHFENAAGPLADGMAFLIGALRVEASGQSAHEARLMAAQRLFAAAWSLMQDGHDIEVFRQAATADMPELPPLSNSGRSDV